MTRTTTSNMEIQPDDLLLMVMNPDDLRDLWKISVRLWSEADKKIWGADMTFNELAGDYGNESMRSTIQRRCQEIPSRQTQKET